MTGRHLFSIVINHEEGLQHDELRVPSISRKGGGHSEKIGELFGDCVGCAEHVGMQCEGLTRG